MESLNGKLSDELLNREAFETLMGKWRREHNQRWERSRGGIRWPGNRGRPNRSPEFQLGHRVSRRPPRRSRQTDSPRRDHLKQTPRERGRYQGYNPELPGPPRPALQARNPNAAPFNACAATPSLRLGGECVSQ